MRHPLPTRPLLLWTLPFQLAAAYNFDCNSVVANEHPFNFGPLAGPHYVSHVTESNPALLNTTYSVNICESLERDRNIDPEEQCPKGTWICAITNLIKGDHRDIEHVVSIARQSADEHVLLEPKVHILPDPDSNADSKKEGVRVILQGGKDTKDGKKIPQQAVIEFLCKNETNPASADHIKTAVDEDEPSDAPHEEWDALKTTKDGHGGTLTFISYNSDDSKGSLHLEWNTKYACRDYDGADEDASPSRGSGGGWGFFSWLFFLGFLGLIGYFAFFAWINYNKYGATGWDLVPHADTIRDIPYVLSEWGYKVIGTVTGGPSRGGYSAV